ncbi:MAG: hypothetical protein AB1791_12895 [Chloroflexota bacterium]
MKSRSWLRLVFLLYILLAVGYSLLMPTWEAPDETAHYLVAYYLAREGRFPTPAETYEAIQPPLYYWLAAGVLRLLDQMSPELVNPYRPPLSPPGQPTRYEWTADNYRFLWSPQVLRWLNIGVGGLALLFIYKGARRLLETDYPHPTPLPGKERELPPLSLRGRGVGVRVIALATVTLVALTPQFLHNSAAGSNDPLANLAGAFLFYLLGYINATTRSSYHVSPFTFRGFTPIWLVGVAAVAVAATLLVKLTVLPMTLTVLVAIALRGHGWLAAGGRRPAILRLLIGGALLGLLLAAVLYWLVPSPWVMVLRTLWWRLTYVRPEFSTRWPLMRVATFYVATYWGQVAWSTVRLPEWILGTLTGLAALGWLASLRLLFGRAPLALFWRWLMGAAALVAAAFALAGRFTEWWDAPLSVWLGGLVVLVVAWWRQRQVDPAGVLSLGPLPVTDHENPRQSAPSAFHFRRGGSGWGLVWLAAVLAFVIVFRNFLTTPQYQSRFLFPALGPISLLMTAGWYTLLPPRLAGRLPHLVLMVLLILNGLLWFTRIIPIFYQPFLD